MTEWRKQISLLLDKKHLFMPCEITDAASETDYCCTSDNAVNRTHVNVHIETHRPPTSLIYSALIKKLRPERTTLWSFTKRNCGKSWDILPERSNNGR